MAEASVTEIDIQAQGNNESVKKYNDRCEILDILQGNNELLIH